ncbi:hypothetical protein GDO86_006034 [Hymenochirus boettgeri]|uniref:Uncharacterized protein n=1 Tax=Hymenochirus boettgeri TaxID=247094 RepID=A0A8T2JCA9_9PIPI|nr:hypothetical protein GDO86_006034 [Hymenochirus boettgeri]
MSLEYGRRRRNTHDTFDFPREFEHRVDAHHRRGSLCDKHCGINIPTDLVDTHSGSHQHSLLTPRLLPGSSSTPICCPHNSEEVQQCNVCMIKTTITAENEVEALKLSNNYKFGFKKWKGHVTERPWEDRSEIVKELYSDLNIVKTYAESLLSFGNILYVVLFGWWIAIVYFLVSILMFLSILGIPYGKLCLRLAKYFIWPFGKVILKSGTGHTRKCCVRFTKCEAIPEVDEMEKTPLLEKCESPHTDLQHPDVNFWYRISTYFWIFLGFPILAVAHGFACFVSWILVFFIPVSKMNARMLTKVLLTPPEHVHIRSTSKMEVSYETDVTLCCYHAINIYYYKYTVDGLNVFAVNLMLLVIVSLALGYGDHHNHYTSSPVKFTLSLISIMPLSYYIGMAIASVSAQSNFAVGAVVNATFGSIIELTFYITALIKGAREGNRCYEELVKSALTGTLLGCVLFVPGLCMIIGGIKHREQRFNSRSAGVGSALLFISVGGVFAPTLFSKVYGKMLCGECIAITENTTEKYICNNCQTDIMELNSTTFYTEVKPLVYTVSILLPAAYVIGLIFTLKTHSHIYDIHISDCHVPGHHHSAVVHWSRWRAMVILLVSTFLMSACADLATEHISPIMTGATVSQYFIGVTVLALIPELPEIVNGIQFALLNNLSLSIEIGSCIAVQVCMLQIPILVLFSVFYATDFTLVFNDLHLWACMFSVILMNYIFMDGKCDYFQAMYFFAPSPVGC